MSLVPPAKVRRKGDLEIQDVSAWILRAGVVSSVAVMLLGLLLSFLRGAPSVAEMETFRFSSDFALMLRGVAALNGPAFLELGILILVATPILRVVSSAALFAFVERDWFYTAVTLVVFVMTLVSLFVLN